MSCLLLKTPNEECARQEGIIANTILFSSFFSYRGRPTQENAAHFIKIANYEKTINAKSFSMMANVFLGLFPTRFTRFILVKNVHQSLKGKIIQPPSYKEREKRIKQ